METVPRFILIINVLDAEYDRLKKVLVKDEYKYALSKIFKSFYITCQAEMSLNDD